MNRVLLRAFANELQKLAGALPKGITTRDLGIAAATLGGVHMLRKVHRRYRDGRDLEMMNQQQGR